MCCYEMKQKSALEPLFEGWEETFICSCLQGYMGAAYANDPNRPESAQIVLGDICFFAGAPNEALARNIPAEKEFAILVPQHEGWSELIERVYGSKAARWMRYATKKESDGFDEKRLRAYIARLPDEYQLRMIDEELFEQIQTLAWARDLCSQFRDYQSFEDLALGVVACWGGVVVSGASAYAVYRGGIEVEVDTREDMRRRGLALACSAMLILECQKRGLYPSWDAHNEESLALAEKLGYRPAKTYPAYELVR